jgi:hypothetical protein
MSCDWNIYCKTCDSTHGFADANYQKELMVMLIAHASEIAGLLPLVKDDSVPWIEITVRTTYGSLDIEWFHEHHTHVLVPIDEYGRIAE